MKQKTYQNKAMARTARIQRYVRHDNSSHNIDEYQRPVRIATLKEKKHEGILKSW